MSYGYNTYQPPYKPMYGQPQTQYQPIPIQQYQQPPQMVQPAMQQWQQPQEQPQPVQPAPTPAPQEPQITLQEPDSNQELATAIHRLCDLVDALYGDYRKEVQKIWTSDR